MSEPSHMFCKIVQSGDVVESYIYSNAIKVGQERQYDIVRQTESNVDNSEEEVKRRDNLLRARQQVRRLCWCNQGKHTKFITLTFSGPEGLAAKRRSPYIYN